MTDQELADRVVALGVGNKTRELIPHYIINDHSYTADKFLLLWDVAGALMEKCGGVYVHSEVAGQWHAYAETHMAVKLPVQHYVDQNESLPRAIIEACTEALSDD